MASMELLHRRRQHQQSSSAPAVACVGAHDLEIRRRFAYHPKEPNTARSAAREACPRLKPIDLDRRNRVMGHAFVPVERVDSLSERQLMQPAIREQTYSTNV
jgi:hypothetical protein